MGNFFIIMNCMTGESLWLNHRIAVETGMTGLIYFWILEYLSIILF